MGEAEFNAAFKKINIHSNIIVYGKAANDTIAEAIRDEMETMWNEPNAAILINRDWVGVEFRITASLQIHLQPLDIFSNTDSRNNFFRVEDYSSLNISFVDGVGCNSGYFFTENLYKGSTTAAHEYGHTLGLDHPKQLDIRGKGRPGIMYPRGTIVDPQFQYDPAIPAGARGGTMHPIYRKVSQLDIDNLQLQKLRFKNGRVIVGSFTNIYHASHVR